MSPDLCKHFVQEAVAALVERDREVINTRQKAKFSDVLKDPLPVSDEAMAKSLIETLLRRHATSFDETFDKTNFDWMVSETIKGHRAGRLALGKGQSDGFFVGSD